MILALAALALLAAPAAAGAAAPAPAWSITSLAVPTNFRPGDDEHDYYQVEVANSGAAVTDGSPLVIADTLPAGLEVSGVELGLRKSLTENADFGEEACAQEEVAGAATVTCTISESLPGAFEAARLWPGEFIRLTIHVKVPNSTFGALANEASVQGGGAALAAARTEGEASFSAAAPGFAEFATRLTGPDGGPVSQAASHPFAYTTTYALNTELTFAGEVPVVTAGGDPKDLRFELPPGLVGNAAALPRCPAAQFATQRQVLVAPGQGTYVNDCPDSSALGTVAVHQIEGGPGGEILGAVYNLIPPPGQPAQFGFQVIGLPIYIDTEVRSGSDYGVTARVRNLTQIERVTAATLSLWGDPADPAHDRQRGLCAETNAVLGAVPITCPFEAPERPFLRLPTSCAAPLISTATLYTWLHPETPYTDTDTDPAPSGCAALAFEPTLQARPTTTLADSPSGLDVDLHIPQPEACAPGPPRSCPPGEADLRETTVVLPAGIAVNPASAAGLAGCSEAELDLHGTGPAQCPDAAKIGTVKIDTPLLDHPLPAPGSGGQGAVYLATPHHNPFGSLLAIYIVIYDPPSGVSVKLAGRVSADPASGQLTTTVSSSPQLPFEDFRFHFFEGARAPLRTPPVCGAYSTDSLLTPHSAPEGAPVPYSDHYSIDASPAGGACPTAPGALPNAPSFAAGTESPIAGAESPVVLNLARSDGSQEFSRLTLTPPPGLLARLAGVPYCPEAALAAAAQRSGAAERAAPSCPAASRVGVVHVAAGAGPAPYWTAGAVYLAGPYAGAPASLAIITPALAGPFDLGTVVVRTALRIDPASAQITAVSDPIPHILAGIPLDLRRIIVRLDHPGWGLNPTDCEPLAFGGTLTSTLGQSAALASRFQVGECGRLAFKPRLTLRLKGATRRTAHPKLIANLRASPGEANIARAQVKLPKAAFLDQSHIGTVCTRVQFAADSCPKGSVYGRASATTPLLDYPLSGPVYLRSSSHTLPDLVVKLRGPAHQPIEVDLVGRTDSVKGALRNTFEAVPDAPVSRFHLELFGGRRGLVELSSGLCRRPRATVRMTAQNAKLHETRPVVRTACKHKPKRKRHRRHRRR